MDGEALRRLGLGCVPPPLRAGRVKAASWRRAPTAAYCRFWHMLPSDGEMRRLVRGRVRGARVSGGARGARGAIARVHVYCAAVSAPRGEFARDGIGTRLHGRYCIIALELHPFFAKKYLLLVGFWGNCILFLSGRQNVSFFCEASCYCCCCCCCAVTVTAAAKSR